MHIDYLIIGQGISGTWLSYYLQQAGQSFLVIDESKPNTASKVASGIINPVTGRRIVKTWMIDDLLPFVWNEYNKFGIETGTKAIEQKTIVDFFPTPQMKLAFEKRFNEDSQYLSLAKDADQWRSLFHYDFDFGEITPSYLINLAEIIPGWRKILIDKQQLLEESFDPGLLSVDNDQVKYKDISASKIIFCDGIGSSQNPWFSNLPFAFNKGEAVLAEIDGLSKDHIFKKGFSLVPWKDNIYWLGSSYLWEFTDDQPTSGFRQFAEHWLRLTIKVPFKVFDHMAAIRPATLERRPFVGFHPLHKNIGILNGMGTKGCSLAPFFALQMREYLLNNKPIMPEADVQRFKKVLTRQ